MSLSINLGTEDSEHLLQAYYTAGRIGFIIRERSDGKYAFFKPGREEDAFVANSPRQLAKWLGELVEAKPRKKSNTTTFSPYLFYRVREWAGHFGYQLGFNDEAITGKKGLYHLAPKHPNQLRNSKLGPIVGSNLEGLEKYFASRSAGKVSSHRAPHVVRHAPASLYVGRATRHVRLGV